MKYFTIFIFYLFMSISLHAYNIDNLFDNKFFDKQKNIILEDKNLIEKNNNNKEVIINIQKKYIDKNLEDEDFEPIIEEVLSFKKYFFPKNTIFINYLENKKELIQFLNIDLLFKSRFFLILNKDILCVKRAFNNNMLKECNNFKSKYFKRYLVLDGEDKKFFNRLIKKFNNNLKIEETYFLEKDNINQSNYSDINHNLYSKAKNNKNGFKKYIYNEWAKKEKERLYAKPYIKDNLELF